MQYENIKNIYPSVLVQYDGDETTVSIEWYEQNKSSLRFVAYTLILLYKDGSKEELYFDDYSTMITTMEKLYNSLKK